MIDPTTTALVVSVLAQVDIGSVLDGVNPIVESMAGAVLYSTVFYAKNYLKKGGDQTLAEYFDPVRFASTLIAGVLVGTVMRLSGFDLSQAGLESALLANAGLVAVVDATISSVLDGRTGDTLYNGRESKAARENARPATEDATATATDAAGANATVPTDPSARSAFEWKNGTDTHEQTAQDDADGP